MLSQRDHTTLTMTAPSSAQPLLFSQSLICLTIRCNALPIHCYRVSDSGVNIIRTVLNVHSFLFSPSTAPCVPRNTRGRLDCVSNSAWVTWDTSEGALSYFVLAQEVGGHNSTCTTTASPCNVPDLKCGAVYTFHVTAVNSHCWSNHSNTFELETGIQQNTSFPKKLKNVIYCLLKVCFHLRPVL